MALLDSFDSEFENPVVDLSDFQFISDNHTRYENEQAVEADNRGSMRSIRVQKSISDGMGYTVTMYNIEKSNSLSKDNIQMSPKQMKIIHNSNAGIELRGFGNDIFGNSFSDYGIVIHLMNKLPTKITLKLYDRRIYIIYKKFKPATIDYDFLTMDIVANHLVQQHFEHYLSTNQEISVDDLEEDIANLINYLRLYKRDHSVFKLTFLDQILLDYVRNSDAEFASNILNQTMELYPQHFKETNSFCSENIEKSNYEEYEGNRLAEFLKDEYRTKHLYDV